MAIGMNTIKCWKWMAGFAAGLAALFSPATAADELSAEVDFARDIRPILSDNCFTCHGPDKETREAKLRLDTQEGLHGKAGGERAVVQPGSRAASELFRRISAQDPDDRMPPPEFSKHLSPEQIELIGQWIDAGAEWEAHWAFIAPQRPALPKVKNEGWIKNPIDRFVLARLEREGLAPNPEAGRKALMRRATLDATGLPPTLEEIDAFLAEDDPKAYERLVDRLLESPHYGEHKARYWLDAARYADTHGYHIDAERIIWPYRDWVIDAFNENKPFDEFTVEQLAGDLLPEPTLEQRIASGFNRCNMTTGEGGAIAEEYRMKYAVDRVDTTATVWLGLTMACAQCHDHKYDPISQKEFYEFFAFFNTVDEPALDGNRPNPGPFVKVPSEQQKRELAALEKRLAKVQERMKGALPAVDEAQEVWQKEWSTKLGAGWNRLRPQEVRSRDGAELEVLEDHSVLADGENPAQDVYEVVVPWDGSPVYALQLEALTHESLPHGGAGRADNANFVLGEVELAAAREGEADAGEVSWEKVQWLSATADYAQDKFPISNAIDGNAQSGWAVDGNKKREDRLAVFLPEQPVGEGARQLRVALKFETPHGQHAIGRFRLSAASSAEVARLLGPPLLSQWRSVGPFQAASGEAAYATAFGPEENLDLSAGSRAEEGEEALRWVEQSEFGDGQVNDLQGENAATYLHRTIRTPVPREMTVSLGSDDALKVWLNGKVVLDANVQRGIAPDQHLLKLNLAAGENQLLMKVVNYAGGYAFYFDVRPGAEPGQLPLDVVLALAAKEEQRSSAQQERLKDYYRRTYSEEWKRLDEQATQLAEEKKKLEESIPTSLVMREMEKPRKTFILERGEYDQPTTEVEPGLPSVLPPLVEEKPDRLALARWLVKEDHPLTARVTVNRLWQSIFGVGLVMTAEDFGTQGEPPSHPGLLDWLAREFIESGWDMKHMHRLILTSATYRQSSRARPELLARDPQNRLLARGPRFRMDAEMLRDNALAVSGILERKIGGKSVKPYEPPGLWEAVSYGFSQKYEPDEGADRYRRSLYTFWKRQSPPPNLMTFDAPTREMCTVRRPRTNTPMQALVLLNDPQFVEAARGFAQHVLQQPGDDRGRLLYAFRRATAREPKPEELSILARLLEEQRNAFEEDPAAAKALLATGALDPMEEVESIERAAWTTVASTLLNLDETITKN